MRALSKAVGCCICRLCVLSASDPLEKNPHDNAKQPPRLVDLFEVRACLYCHDEPGLVVSNAIRCKHWLVDTATLEQKDYTRSPIER